MSSISQANFVLMRNSPVSSFSGIILVCGSGHRVLHNGHIGPQAICPSFTDDGSVACGYLSSVTVSTWSQGNSACGVEMEVGK
ncbi:hypothetical protein VFPPC_08642 [Pochonia chlamydosporia 170]|uniref:Uncharacterized protein n=1 Tax=Pochonia chlamydosporia 170 TaxID=1380566 RepID=A0A179FNP7_METCM|nr:hypothetical protein VFPPC_08642 [Pochonia chlamydosporia 170]OAQ67204.1 hypothetical protein VFPPC_08642 [Pochonia chlamydosporia 170]